MPVYIGNTRMRVHRGASQVKVKKGNGVPPVDTTAPTLSAVSISSVGASSAGFNARSNEAGKIYWAAYTTQATRTDADVEAATGAVASGVITAVANTTHLATIAGLEATTNYYVYCFAEDAALNRTAVQDVSFTTIASGLTLPITTSATLAVQDQTYDSTLRPANQGVYDHESNKTFFCVMLAGSTPHIIQIDHNNSNAITTHQVWAQPSPSKYNYPNLILLHDRRIAVVFADPFDDGVGFAVSNNPADPTAFTKVRAFDGHTEYPKIMQAHNGDIYLFFTHMDGYDAPAHQRWLYYVKSTDGGATWGTKVLCLERDLAEPNGMCEQYVSYYMREPARNGEPERWWFSYTAAGGFQFEGAHDGANGANVLQDLDFNFAQATMSYRYLYNKTKGTHSAIASNTGTTVTPENPAMVFDTGDLWGIAYHNIYHANLYASYYRPDTGHWYNAAHQDLGVKVDRFEMDSAINMGAASPNPPTAKHTGYVNAMAVNGNGEPVFRYGEGFRKWDAEGQTWGDVADATQPGADIRYFYWADGYYFFITDKLNAYRSLDLVTWEQIGNWSAPSAHSYSCYAVAVHEGHADAIINLHEYGTGMDGNAYVVPYGTNQTPGAILLRAATHNVAANGSLTINAYVCDKVLDARSRCMGATDQITLSVVSGGGSITTANVNAVSGKAAFTFNAPATPGEVVLEASGAGLDSYRITLTIQ